MSAEGDNLLDQESPAENSEQVHGEEHTSDENNTPEKLNSPDQNSKNPEHLSPESSEENSLNDMEQVFGDMGSSSDSSDDDSEEEDLENDVYEQEAKNKLQNLVAEKKRKTRKKDKSDEPPRKKRRLPGEKKEKAVRAPRRRGRSQEEITKIVTGLLDKMKDAFDNDLLNMESKRPALQKVMLLPEVERNITNTTLQRHFIDSHILDELGKWMRPLADKSLPSLDIRKKILKILYSLEIPNISLEVLKDSGVGKFVHLYSIHPKETRENKALASKILNRWLDLSRGGGAVRNARAPASQIKKPAKTEHL